MKDISLEWERLMLPCTGQVKKEKGATIVRVFKELVIVQPKTAIHEISSIKQILIFTRKLAAQDVNWSFSKVEWCLKSSSILDQNGRTKYHKIQ